MRISTLIVFAALAVVVTCSSSAIESLMKQRAGLEPNHAARSVESLTCFKITCVGLGANCTVLFDTNTFEYTYYPLCTNGECPQQEPKLCQALPSPPTEGQACNQTTGCASGLDCNSVSKTCANFLNEINAGSPCSSNSDCQYTNQYQQCVSGVCKGLSPGDSCNYTNQCSGFSECTSGVCSSFVGIGGSCSGTTTCAIGDCVNGACVQVGSVAAGGTCDDDDDLCADGLFCNTTSNQCQAVASSGGQACNASSDCPYGNSCECNFNNGASTCQAQLGNPSGYASAQQALENCAYSNNVYDLPNALKHCKSQTCAYFRIVSNSQSSATGNYPSCYFGSSSSSYFTTIINAACSSSTGDSNVLTMSASLFVGAISAAIIL